MVAVGLVLGAALFAGHGVVGVWAGPVRALPFALCPTFLAHGGW